MPAANHSSYTDTINMDRLRGILSGRDRTKTTRDANPDEYEPLRTSGDDGVEAGDTPEVERERERERETYEAAEVPFSWFEYTIFALVGVAMLWAW